MKTFALLATPLALLAATPAFAQAMSAKDYVAAAGASDLYEKQSSQLVLQTSTDANVRSFAQMMIQDHTKSTTMVKTAAMKSHVKPAPPKLMPAQAEMIAQLQAESGPSRDAAYIAQQKQSHNQALSLQTAYASDGTAPPLRMVAAKIVPVVQSHIDMLMKM